MIEQILLNNNEKCYMNFSPKNFGSKHALSFLGHQSLLHSTVRPVAGRDRARGRLLPPPPLLRCGQFGSLSLPRAGPRRRSAHQSDSHSPTGEIGTPTATSNLFATFAVLLFLVSLWTTFFFTFQYFIHY
jgi:hypothetical protein